MNNTFQLAVTVGWLISTACLLSLVYGLYEVDLSPVTGAAYSSLSHSAWALGLAWIVIACSTGHGGIVFCLLGKIWYREQQRSRKVTSLP